MSPIQDTPPHDTPFQQLPPELQSSPFCFLHPPLPAPNPEDPSTDSPRALEHRHDHHRYDHRRHPNALHLSKVTCINLTVLRPYIVPRHIPPPPSHPLTLRILPLHLLTTFNRTPLIPRPKHRSLYARRNSPPSHLPWSLTPACISATDFFREQWARWPSRGLEDYGAWQRFSRRVTGREERDGSYWRSLEEGERIYSGEIWEFVTGLMGDVVAGGWGRGWETVLGGGDGVGWGGDVVWVWDE